MKCLQKIYSGVAFGTLCLFSGFSFAETDTSSSQFKAGEAIMLRIPLDTASVFNGVFPIDLNGMTTLPMIGKQRVHGKSMLEVETLISTLGAAYMRDIHIMATPVIRLSLLGYWQKPGMFYVPSQTSVWEACLLAGGPAGERNLKRWRVYRGENKLDISLLNAYSQGITLRDAGIQSGDIFAIPVPDPQRGFWFQFRETLTVVGQLASITSTVLLTYLIFDGSVTRN